MFYKIIAFGFLPLLVLSLFLSFAGVIYIDPNSGLFMDLIRSTAYRLSLYKFEIPNIPSVPSLAGAGVGFDILNALITFVNGFVSMLNVLVLVINVVLSVLQFIITFVYTISDFIRGVPVVPNPLVI